MNMPGGQYDFETVGNTYRYVFRTQKDWLRIGTNAVILVIVAFLLLPGDLLTILNKGFGQVDPKVLLLDVIVVALLAPMALDLLYQLTGREVVELSDEAVVIRHQILGIGPSRRTPAEKVSGLFIAQQGTQPGLRFGGSRYGFFDFSHGRVALGGGKDWLGAPRSYRFGAGLDEAEARRLVAQMLQRFPRYQAKPEK